jgi:N-methylhydantoinase A
LRIGIDVGGTFTDLIFYNDKTNKTHIYKTLTNKETPWISIIKSIRENIKNFNEIEDIRHGTTIGVNTIIEQKGSKTSLITTDGFRDLLEIGRQKRPELYNLRLIRSRPLIPRNLRQTVKERIKADGTILKKLDLHNARRTVQKLKKNGVESIAVLFLHSFVNNTHEKKLASIIKEEIPGIYISLSSEVIPEFREYERLATTVLNAYLGPVFIKYLKNLLEKLRKSKIKSSFYIGQSDGGITSAESTINLPVRTLYSGPSAGVIGTSSLYGKENSNLITLDMGGTSTDIALISESRPAITTEKEINGYPIKFPTIDVSTIGAGGGSIAKVDEGGFLQLGPSSAGADPGPACYDKGGSRPTVTDADLILGLLGVRTILGGKIKLNKSKSETAIKTHVSIPLKISLRESAISIVRLVVSNISEAAKKISISKGIHPEDVKLVAYGGAGPMHAADVARELGIKEVIVPNNPGVFSASGLLYSDLTMDFVRTVKGLSSKEINAIAKYLKKKGNTWFKKEKIPPRKQKIIWSADIRYYGQNYEINIPIKDPNLVVKTNYSILESDFHNKHSEVYGIKYEEKQIEIINLRLRCISLTSVQFKNSFSERLSNVKDSLKEIRNAEFTGIKNIIKTPVYKKEYMTIKIKIDGPAILEGTDSTIVIPPGDTAIINHNSDTIISVNER